ncbi:epimerase [Bacterioplanes sanyensis]|uniref:Epimerase n=1 Tax=Bacterioplanes sanyensis TaxID=1249553 RepID=A0A222FIA7_9GAMM|nr:NmrA family NAD(P)-binding protein [Bacterioplanes sanyensis]ASP38718.1 epimerase [Bacterioplanes sanyensis]
MNHSELYVVTGATGRTGMATANALLNKGKRVRVVLRTAQQQQEWQQLGAEVAVADYADPAALCQAFAGASAVYIVSPPQYDSEHLFAQAQTMADDIANALLTAQVQKVVALSSIGAEQPENTGWIFMNHRLEKTLAATGIDVTFLRAAYFMENWAPLVQLAQQQGQLPSFLAPIERRIPMIATADIGALAADAMCEHWQGVRILDLQGPEPYSPQDLASSLSHTLDQALPAAAIAESDWSAAMAGQGFSAAAIDGFCEMTRGLNSGHIAFADNASHERRSGEITLASMVSTLLA